jgi:hypothetical protein
LQHWQIEMILAESKSKTHNHFHLWELTCKDLAGVLCEVP